MRKYQREAFLRQAYIDEKRSARDIGDECGCSHTTIYMHLRMFNIPIRTQKECIKRKQPQKQKKKFSIREYLLNLNKWKKIVKIEENSDILIPIY